MTRFIRYFFIFCLVAPLLRCVLDRSGHFEGGAGGSAGSINTGGTGGTNTGGSAGEGGTNTGGSAGQGGTGGNTGGTGGTAGEGGTGGNTGGAGGQGGTGGGGPCTGIHFAFDSNGTCGLTNNMGYSRVATYQLKNTSIANQFTGSITLTNSPAGDFTSGDSGADQCFAGVLVKCQVPNGSQNFNDVCEGTLTAGVFVCNFSQPCYSNSSQPVDILIQVDPADGQTCQFRIGIDPNSTLVCGSQAALNVCSVSPP